MAQLPPANKDTLAYLILHLQKVAQHSDDNKMTLANLAKIFGPTIVGHASPNPKSHVIKSNIEKQFKVMMILLGIQQGYLRLGLTQQCLLTEGFLRMSHLKQHRSNQDNPEVAAAPSSNVSPPPRSPYSVFSPGPRPLRSPRIPEPQPGVYYNAYKRQIRQNAI